MFNVRAVIVSMTIVLASVMLGGCGRSDVTPSNGGSGAQSSTHRDSTTPAREDVNGAEGPAGAAFALQRQYAKVVKEISPTVVLIETPQGLGSGVVFDDVGDIVTNAHVVGEYTRFQVTLANGHKGAATLVGSYPPDDLAVIHSTLSGLQAASFGESSQLHVGDIVLAVGNPLGLQSSVTDGIVSSLGRTVSEGGGITLPSAIQTSAAINPGNSGGALVDLRGEVVGIPTLAAADPQLGGGAAPGIGFAIPSKTVRLIAPQLIEHGHVVESQRAYLGVSVATLANGEGVYVAGVLAGGPAERAGIEAGDVITAVAGNATPTAEALTAALADLAPDSKVAVSVRRSDGSSEEVEVTLGELPGT